jgi:hypothetical protein
LEATLEGEVVWRYVVAYDDENAGLVYEAERYPSSWFEEDPRRWDCG